VGKKKSFLGLGGTSKSEEKGAEWKKVGAKSLPTESKSTQKQKAELKTTDPVEESSEGNKGRGTKISQEADYRHKG